MRYQRKLEIVEQAQIFDFKTFTSEALHVLTDKLRRWQQYNLADPTWKSITSRFKYQVESDSFKLNAYAQLVEENRALYGYNLGMYLGIDDLFSTLCSYHYFFGDVWTGGLVAKFDIDEPGRYVDYSFLNEISDPNELTKKLYYRLPLDEKRLILCTLLTELALTWAICHEEAHFEFGHLHYIKDKYSQGNHKEAKLLELNNPSQLTLPVNIRKIFEHQADHVASAGVISSYFKNHMLSYIPYSELQNPEGLLRIILVAVGTVGMLFEKAQRHQKMLPIISVYPSAQSRFINCLTSIMDKIIWREVRPNTGDLVLKSPQLTLGAASSAAVRDLAIVADILDIDFSNFSQTMLETIGIVFGNKHLNLEDLVSEHSREFFVLHSLEKQQIVDIMLPYRQKATPEFRNLWIKGGDRV